MKTSGMGSQDPAALGSSNRPWRTFLWCGSASEPSESLSAPRYLAEYRAVRKIHKAASEGDAAKVQHLLDNCKKGVNDTDKKNRTALHYACAYGHPDVVTLLVERKCNIDVCDSDNSTALIKASQCQQEECAIILLKHGANPNIKDSSGNSALHHAIIVGNTSITAALLAHSANIDEKTKDGLTPFMLALKENQQEVAEFLLAEGGNSHGVYKMRSSKTLPECAERRSKVSPNDPEANIIVASEKEQKVINGSEKKLKVKEEKKHESNEMEGPRTPCHSAAAGAAGATVDAELILPRPKSRAANQQFPTAQSEEHDSDLRRGQSKDQPTLRSRPSLPMEKGKKNEHERWNSTEPGTSQMFLNANSLPDHSVHVKYDCTLNEIELDEGRPAKKVPHEKSKVKKQVTFMDDPTNLIESYETVSENSELFDTKKCLCEFEHLDMECKDS